MVYLLVNLNPPVLLDNPLLLQLVIPLGSPLLLLLLTYLRSPLLPLHPLLLVNPLLLQQPPLVSLLLHLHLLLEDWVLALLPQHHPAQLRPPLAKG